jgi:hypothetical protein
MSTKTAQLQPTNTGSTVSPTCSTKTNNTLPIRIRLLNVGFVDSYRNKNSIDYKNLSGILVLPLVGIFRQKEGFCRIADVDFEPGSVIANIQTEFSSENTRVSTSSLAKAVIDASDENGKLGELHFDTTFLQEQITPTTAPTTEISNEEEDDDHVYMGVGIAIGIAALVCGILALCLVSVNI